MTTLAQPSLYTKEYLPGYTGHVPSKNERYGSTAGQIKREVQFDSGMHPIILQSGRDQSKGDGHRLYSSRFVPAIDKNKEVHGNQSGFAKNWVCGPNHEIRNQQVPGYTGHIKGLVSENLFAYSYGNTTAKAIGKKHPIGHNVEPRERFLSQNTSQYKAKNFRRFIEHPTMKPRKDYDDYARFINDTYSAEKEKMLSSTVNYEHNKGTFTKNYNPMNTLKTQSRFGASGFKPTRTNSSIMGGSVTEKAMGSTLNDFDVKPKLLESKISQRQDFFALSDGFKKIFAKDKPDQKIVIPIAGYGGHRRGERSQNFFGKSFREQSLQSKKLERDFRGASVM